MKFMYNGIKINGVLYRAWYSDSKLINGIDGTITIYAKDYKPLPLIEGLNIRNDTDSQTDYFEKDRIRVTPDNEYYPAVLAAMEKLNEHNNKRRGNNG